jgi:acyl-CoA synthetase (AMP-forming)/AMP-acid ligase II
MPDYANPFFQPSTLVELLGWRASINGNERAYTFLSDGEQGECHLTYAELDQQARRVGALLQRQGLAGRCAILLYPAGLEFLAAFFGCLYAGVTAVPVYPPPPNRPAPRLKSILTNAQAAVILTTASIASPAYRQRLLAYTPEVEALRWLTTGLAQGAASTGETGRAQGAAPTDGTGQAQDTASTDEFMDDDGVDWKSHLLDRDAEDNITSDTLAFIQYTSGSTGTPKGVRLTHGNLMDNLSLIKYGFQFQETDKCISWLPLSHDMGLIGHMLGSLCNGSTCVFMSPMAFLQRPIRWLQAISRERGTVSGAPNMAYQLCCDKISASQLSALDLSSWRLAFSGSEPVRSETLMRFAQKFAPCGFRLDAFYPCYGLAEATLLVAGGLGPAQPKVCTLLRSALAEDRVVEVCAGEDSVEASPIDTGLRRLVSCGKTLQHVVVVDVKTQTRLLPDQVGEIWVASKSVAPGYWNGFEETEHSFHAVLSGHDDMGACPCGCPFLRTGDLGFIHEGELYITGRLKDLVVIKGRHHYPQDIELTVEQSSPFLSPGSGAAFTVKVAEEEQLVIVQEVERRYRSRDAKEIVNAIRQAVAEYHGVQVYAVVLIRPGSIPRTSSGKVQHYVCRDDFESGRLSVIESVSYS